VRYWFPLALVLLLLLALPGFVLFIGDLLGYEAELNTSLERRFGLSHHLPIALGLGVVLFLVPVLILLLYFLKLKRKPQVVSSTFLWKKSIEDLHVNRLMQWLRRNVLLLLQLLVILSLIYAILAPKFHTGGKPGKYYILIIDQSASMSATDVDPNRLEWAKREARKEIDAASDDDQGMIIVFSSSAETRQGYTNNRALLRSVIDAIEPTNRPTRVEEALSLAESLANPTRSTENEAVRPQNAEPGKERQYATAEGVPTDVHLYSDGRFPDVPSFALSNLQLTLHVPPHAEKGNANNLAIVGFDAFRDDFDPNKLIAHARVVNFRNQQAPVTVIVEEIRDGEVRFLRQQSVFLLPRKFEAQPIEKDEPSETTVRFELSEVDTTRDSILRVRLTGHSDHFSADDRAWLVLGIARKSQLMLVGDINPVLKDTFESPVNKLICDVTYLKAEEMKDQKYLDPARSGAFDLVIFESCAPPNEESMPRANTLFLGAPPPPWHFGGEKNEFQVEKVEFPQIRGWTDQHPAMKGIRAWHELLIAEGFRMKNLPPKSPKLLEGGSDLVLATALSRGAYTDVVVAFPIAADGEKWNTNWILRASFPIFLRNVLYSYGNVRESSTESSIRPGEPKIISPGLSVKAMEVVSPSGKKSSLERGTRPEFVFGQTEELGSYEANWQPKERQRFAVNLFDLDESHIEPREIVQIGSEKITSGEPRKQPRELWRWFVLAGLLFVLLEWWVYNKRVQV
jgi:hypothetical protein